MELWYHEHEPGYGYGVSYKITKALHHEVSDFQEIQILETEGFGRMLVLDKCVQVTERDEFLYHEMLVHPAMCIHPNPKKVLIIGGGDGGTAREVLRHPDVQVDMCEIDGAVIEACKKYLPTMACAYDNPRLNLHVADGVAFMKDNSDTFDLIIIDSTDPVGLAEGLVTSDFYQTCYEALHEDGAIVLQSESPLVHQQTIQKIHTNLKAVFPQTHLYTSPVVFYPTGFWSFTFASKTLHPTENFVRRRAQQLAEETSFYNPGIHYGAFAQPNFVKKILAGETFYPARNELVGDS